MIEHPEWDDLPLAEYVQRADRVEQAFKLARGMRNQEDPRGDAPRRVYSILKPQGRPENSTNLRNRPEKGTDEWKQWCRNEKACFECGKKGHSYAQCYRRKDKGTTRGRSSTPAGAYRNPRDTSNSRTRIERSRSRSQPRDKTVSFQSGN